MHTVQQVSINVQCSQWAAATDQWQQWLMVSLY